MNFKFKITIEELPCNFFQRNLWPNFNFRVGFFSVNVLKLESLLYFLLSWLIQIVRVNKTKQNDNDKNCIIPQRGKKVYIKDSEENGIILSSFEFRRYLWLFIFTTSNRLESRTILSGKIQEKSRKITIIYPWDLRKNIRLSREINLRTESIIFPISASILRS